MHVHVSVFWPRQNFIFLWLLASSSSFIWQHMNAGEQYRFNFMCIKKFQQKKHFHLLYSRECWKKVSMHGFSNIKKHYLHSGVARQFRWLIVDWDNGHRDGEGETPALYLIGWGRECETILGALSTVMHVVDMSKFHLEKTKGTQRHSVLTQTWLFQLRERSVSLSRKGWIKVYVWVCFPVHQHPNNILL